MNLKKAEYQAKRREIGLSRKRWWQCFWTWPWGHTWKGVWNGIAICIYCCRPFKLRVTEAHQLEHLREEYDEETPAS